eukprot:6470184-Lingulodinium_polyedra.AAC.1
MTTSQASPDVVPCPEHLLALLRRFLSGKSSCRILSGQGRQPLHARQYFIGPLAWSSRGASASAA